MRDKSLQDKFFDIIWKAIKESHYTGRYLEAKFSCRTTEAIYRTVHFGHFFVQRKTQNDMFDDYERFYTNIRSREELDWSYIRTDFYEVWYELLQEFPEFNAIEVLYV